MTLDVTHLEEPFVPQTNNVSLLSQLHRDTPCSLIGGRNIRAGYARGDGLVFQKLLASLEEDPVYQESYALGKEMSYLPVDCLANIFLILKYGVSNLCSPFLVCGKNGASPKADLSSRSLENNGPFFILECGSFRGGSAFFIANVARRLGLPVIVYALDTFSGIPEENEKLDFYERGSLADVSFEELLERKEQAKLNNLFFIKGKFQETMPCLFSTVREVSKRPIVLAHIDCVAYDSMKYALTAVRPLMHPAGGYIIVDHAIRGSSSLGVFQAMEEMVQQYQLHAEQTAPHFVYRVFKT